MSTPTAAELIARIRHNPELIEDIRQLLNKEAGYTTQQVHTSHELSPQTERAYALGRPASNKERDQTIAQRVWNGEKRRDVAKEYQLSLPRINQILAEYPNPNPQPRASANAERDAKIVARAREKVTRAQIAREFNLSVIRVNQIVGSVPKPKKVGFGERVAEAMRKYDAYEALTFEDDCLILLTKYEPMARKITQHMIDGMTTKLIHAWEFPADCTGGDIAWTPEHYEQVANIMYDFNAGIWLR